MGGAFGLTAKTPIEMFEITEGKSRVYIQDNGVRREFCENCGAFICEYGEANVNKFRYVSVDKACRESHETSTFC